MSLNFSDFYTIFNPFYKLAAFENKKEKRDLQLGPWKDLDLCNQVLRQHRTGAAEAASILGEGRLAGGGGGA